MGDNQKCLEFLYKWTTEGKLPHIRRGMVEELEAFVVALKASEQVTKITEVMASKMEEVVNNETNS